MHTYIHIYIYAHTYIHTRAQQLVVGTWAQGLFNQRRSFTPTHTRPHPHTHTCTHTHIFPRTHTHAHTHARTHAMTARGWYLGTRIIPSTAFIHKHTHTYPH